MKKGFTLIELLIVVAIIAILAAIAVPNFLEAQTRSRVSRVQADQRSVQIAIESYYVDCSSYPAQASSFPSQGAYGVNDVENAPLTASVSCRYMPTFMHKGPPNAADYTDRVYTLTTPIQYMSAFVADPFATSKGASYSYSTAGTNGQSWIMWSYGPDSDERMQNPDTAPDAPDGNGSDIVITTGGPWRNQPGVETNYFSPVMRIPSEKLLIATYDPTNGTNSSGDVYKYKN